MTIFLFIKNMGGVTLPNQQSVLFDQTIESLKRIYSMDISGLKDALQKAVDETSRLTKVIEERAEFHIHERKSLKEKILELKKSGNEKLKRMHQEFLRKQQILTLRHEKLHSRYKELVEILLQNNMDIPVSHHVGKRSPVLVRPVEDLTASKLSSLSGGTKPLDEVEGVENLHVTLSLATDTDGTRKEQGVIGGLQQEMKIRGKRLGPSDDFVQDSPTIHGNVYFKRPRKLIKQESRVGTAVTKESKESCNSISHSSTSKRDQTQLTIRERFAEDSGAQEDSKTSQEKVQDLPLTDRPMLSFDDQILRPGEILNLTSTLNCETPMLTSTPVPLQEESVLTRFQLQSASEFSAPLSPPIISGHSGGNASELQEVMKQEVMPQIKAVDKTPGLQQKSEQTILKSSLEHDSFWDQDLSPKPQGKENKREGSSDDDMFASEVEGQAKMGDGDGETIFSQLAEHQESAALSQASEDDTFIQNFRRRKKGEPSYKYTEVVRNQDERLRLDGYACRQCEEFYKTENLSKAELQKRLKQVCRHRARFSPPPATPPGFWEIDFPSTGTAKQFMLDENDSLPDHAKPKWRKKR